MTKRERMDAYLFDDAAEMCRCCRYYHKHYIQNRERGGFTEVSYGHCTYPRLKQKRAYDTCDRFTAN